MNMSLGNASDEEPEFAQELTRRIESFERGETELVTPDWEAIVKQAEAIR